MTPTQSTDKTFEISTEEARRAFSDLLNGVGFAGEMFVITRHGKPVAVLVGGDEMREICKRRGYSLDEEAA